ncbi:MAG: hypothetical protein KME52_11810 [Desmonostoc geniculatum HA4340-LM1]|nr:hypothetical protein [Desmonostoc geniculatum HA4340-LM1]
MGWLEDVVRSQQQTLAIADRITQAFAQQQQQLAIADQIVALFAGQQQQLAIADQIVGHFSQALRALQQQEQTLAIADQALNALGPLATNAVVLGEFSGAQDLMIQKLWEILTDPVQCADWYLQLDPPQQRRLVTPSAPVPNAFSRPSFPAAPPPGGVALSSNRDKLQKAWQQNPGMAWQVVDQLASQDISGLFGQ